MMDKVIENNQVTVMGKIVSGFLFSHEIYGEGFYMMDVEVERLSDSTDIIPVMVSDRCNTELHGHECLYRRTVQIL